MVRFALFGAGRIGRMHASNIAANAGCELRYVYDVYEPAGREVAELNGAAFAADVDSVLGDPEVDAVLIASSTDTHVDLIQRAVSAGKRVLCEKPIDLDIARVNACRDQIGDRAARVQIGFNRRFDPNHEALRRAVEAQELGKLEKIVITSRDPAPPPAAYIAGCGGLFRDMMIHDFDLMRFLAGEEPVEITAVGSVLVDDEFAKHADVDTAMVMIRLASGALCHINCSRRAVYGYDQRVEVFGSEGMLLSNNRTATTVSRFSKERTDARDPLLNFFTQRYGDAYRNQIDAFVSAMHEGRPFDPGFEDGRRALVIADAAGESLRTRRTVAIEF